MTYKVIGIHKGPSKRDYNLGTFLKKPLEEFKEKSMKNKVYIENKKEIKLNNNKIKEEKYVEKVRIILFFYFNYFNFFKLHGDWAQSPLIRFRFILLIKYTFDYF